MQSLLKIVLLVCFPSFILGSCFRSVGYKTTDGNPFCVYEQSGGNPRFLLSGEEYTDQNKCLKCICSDGGMQCCGYGVDAGVMQVDPECRVKMTDSCNYIVVRQDDETQKC